MGWIDIFKPLSTFLLPVLNLSNIDNFSSETFLGGWERSKYATSVLSSSPTLCLFFAIVPLTSSESCDAAEQK